MLLSRFNLNKSTVCKVDALTRSDVALMRSDAVLTRSDAVLTRSDAVLTHNDVLRHGAK